MLKIPQKIEYVINLLRKNGFEAYIVGGCVRDMLLGKEPYDFDVTTSAEPYEVQSLFPKTVPTGIKHGTVTVIADSAFVEVTTFRTEGSYTDFRRPDEIRFVKSLREDLARRDFTVNAMAYSTETGLVDYFGGKKDLELRILRAVGEPEKRFGEDALRILRLFRFACVLDFSIEEKTLAAALKCSSLLKSISRERVLAELTKAVMGKNIEVLKALIEDGGLEFLNIKKSPDFTLFKKFNSKPYLALFGFLYLADTDVSQVLTLLKASNRQKDYSNTLLRLLSFKKPETKADLKLMLSVSSPEALYDYLLFTSAVYNYDTKPLNGELDTIIRNSEPYLISHLKIDGEMLKKEGYQGKEIGLILSKLQKAVIENPALNSKERLLEIIKKTS